MNPRRLFVASCIALITTSMVFSIRGDILDSLGADFRLSKEQLGLILGPAFWGFTLSILIGGSLVDFFGMRRLLLISAAGYLIGPAAIIFAPRNESSFGVLYGAMLILGLSQGLVEGVINPLCATMYPNEKTRRMNILHAWWPGGLIIGGLASYGITKLLGLDAGVIPPETRTFGWQIKLALISVPALIYAVLVWSEKFPATERAAAGVSNTEMIGELFKPMFILWWICMWMTASTELGPDQWVGSVITNLAGMQGILILVYTAGLMFLLRFFGGGLTHGTSPMVVLTASAVLSGLGLYWLSTVTTPTEAFLAATVFGVGKTYFWPLMLGVTSERFPKGGPLALAVMGGTGNLAVAFILPMMGGWYDMYGAAAAFRYVSILPAFLTLIFGGLYFYYKSQGGYRVVELKAAPQTGR
jgi:MFS family permease